VQSSAVPSGTGLVSADLVRRLPLANIEAVYLLEVEVSKPCPADEKYLGRPDCHALGAIAEGSDAFKATPSCVAGTTKPTMCAVERVSSARPA
jgi:hypothetical protein